MTIRLPWMSRADRTQWQAARTVPHPPAPAPTVLCTACGCTAIDWQICGDGCSGVTNQPRGLCDACIDPSVIIDWSKELDAAENECALCGAPYYEARRYCSDACERADDSDTPVPAQLPRVIPAHTATDPWS